MKRGTIVLTQFPFTDLSSKKRRPAVIISSRKSENNDVIVAFISSVLSEKISETDLVLKTSSEDFISSGLKKDSVIKLDKICTVNISIISGEVGKLSQKTLLEIDVRLKIALDLK